MKKFVASALSLALLIPAASSVYAQQSVPGYEFNGMPAPKTYEETNNMMYSKASVTLTDADGNEKTVETPYNLLLKRGSVINGKLAGTTVDAKGNVITNENGDPYVSSAADSNSLMKVGDKLYLVNHYESISQTLDGDKSPTRLPNAVYLNTVEQDPKTGELKITDINPIDFSADGGVWTPCAGILSPWNTHLGAEEYEPDARAHEADPENSDVTEFARNYYGDNRIGNPYRYGHLPEISVTEEGKATAVKHYSMGRLSFERTVVLPDNKTVYIGDDGDYTMLFKYIADNPGDLSAGTLYAAKWKQTSAENGGSADLDWIELGHATDQEIKDLVEKEVKFSDIFEVRNPETDAEKQAALDDGFTAVQTNSSGGEVEYLKVKDGMEKAAAFLESRRYGAIKGATSEFRKMEAVDYNKKDNKVYVVMSYIENAMLASDTDPKDDIHVDKLEAGAVYELDLGNDYEADSMKALITGEDLPEADAAGNTANPDKIANPDNIAYAEDLRTLFISEDSDTHSNNFAWAYNIDTKKLSRIASVPGGGEAAGLQYIKNLNGFSYLMLSSQNPSHLGYLQLPETNAPAAPKVNAVSDADTKVTGSAEAGAKVVVNAGDQMLGSATADDEGKFTLSIEKQKAGTKLSAYAEDANFNRSDSVQLTVADKTAPAKPVVDPVTSNDEKVSGTTEAGAKVTVKAGDQVLGNATAKSNGKFKVSIDKQEAGAKLTVTAEDEAGNVSEAATVTVEKAKSDKKDDEQNTPGNNDQNSNNGNNQNTNAQNTNGSQLPDTATGMFNWLFAGAALVIAGAVTGVILWIRRHRLNRI